MAGLEDVFRSAVPGGNIAKPLMLALMGLLASGVNDPREYGNRVAGNFCSHRERKNRQR